MHICSPAAAPCAEGMISEARIRSLKQQNLSAESRLVRKGRKCVIARFLPCNFGRDAVGPVRTPPLAELTHQKDAKAGRNTGAPIHRRDRSAQTQKESSARGVSQMRATEWYVVCYRVLKVSCIHCTSVTINCAQQREWDENAHERHTTTQSGLHIPPRTAMQRRPLKSGRSVPNGRCPHAACHPHALGQDSQRYYHQRWGAQRSKPEQALRSRPLSFGSGAVRREGTCALRACGSPNTKALGEWARDVCGWSSNYLSAEQRPAVREEETTRTHSLTHSLTHSQHTDLTQHKCDKEDGLAARHHILQIRVVRVPLIED
jgi:hypothetical protein